MSIPITATTTTTTTPETSSSVSITPFTPVSYGSDAAPLNAAPPGFTDPTAALFWAPFVFTGLALLQQLVGGGAPAFAGGNGAFGALGNNPQLAGPFQDQDGDDSGGGQGPGQGGAGQGGGTGTGAGGPNIGAGVGAVPGAVAGAGVLAGAGGPNVGAGTGAVPGGVTGAGGPDANAGIGAVPGGGTAAGGPDASTGIGAVPGSATGVGGPVVGTGGAPEAGGRLPTNTPVSSFNTPAPLLSASIQPLNTPAPAFSTPGLPQRAPGHQTQAASATHRPVRYQHHRRPPVSVTVTSVPPLPAHAPGRPASHYRQTAGGQYQYRLGRGPSRSGRPLGRVPLPS